MATSHCELNELTVVNFELFYFKCHLDVSDLKDIIEALKQDYFQNDRWSPLGLQLGLLELTLSSIRTMYQDHPQNCLQEWLTLSFSKADIVAINRRPTLDSLANTLKMSGQMFTAKNIKYFSEYIINIL